MNTMAHWADSGGPGPWILLFPLFWAAAIVGVVTLLRRTVGRARGGQQQSDGPLELLAHRFASGEIDEDEYWMRLSVLRESKGGAK
ncbi:SHOCT domain-containing protein [Streptomyces sp. N2-109]|uniref:SHOCT domain-containing protein n=1 Tax=Streptomyces gossypii TaxID=2883101 RepID=A0ABT2JV72_9ACTN|nr:SHOCT domain-containing protein [Streptomyces gossypii]MCT2591349.1 SHOCT domain-containing protein [Streptomyces gossypii]